jgi:hypothetical protein
MLEGELMGDIQFSQIMQLCALVLILVGAYNTIIGAIKNRREEKKLRDSPVTQLTERVDRHDELLAKDKDRLDAMESRMQDMGEQSTIMLRGVRALLSHEINGNSVDKLKDSMSEIDDYLIRRK